MDLTGANPREIKAGTRVVRKGTNSPILTVLGPAVDDRKVVCDGPFEDEDWVARRGEYLPEELEKIL